MTKKFHENSSTAFCVILLTFGKTTQQTNTEHIFDGGGKAFFKEE